jgi:hypothetical protein
MSAHAHPPRYAASLFVLALTLLGAPACHGPDVAGDLAQVPALTEAPRQRDVAPAPVFERRGWRVVAVADYALTARVLGNERYRFDALAGIVPRDLALAWGPAARDDVQVQLKTWQSGRWLHWRTRGPHPPLAIDVLTRSMANVHVVPLDDDIERVLAHIAPGEVVALAGQLVDLARLDGAQTVRSSRTRTDSGAGACEVLLVTAVRRYARPAPPG